MLKHHNTCVNTPTVDKKFFSNIKNKLLLAKNDTLVIHTPNQLAVPLTFFLKRVKLGATKLFSSIPTNGGWLCVKEHTLCLRSSHYVGIGAKTKKRNGDGV